MRMIEWRQFALTHELPRADLDDSHARGVVEMRNDSLGHVVSFALPARCPLPSRVSPGRAVCVRGRGTIAIRSIDGYPNCLKPPDEMLLHGGGEYFSAGILPASSHLNKLGARLKEEKAGSARRSSQ
jgi:hypothetical protein